MRNVFDDLESMPKRLSSKAVAALLRVTDRTLFNWRDAGIGPPHIRVGRKRIMYDETAVHEWLEKSAAQGAARCTACGGWTSPSKDDSNGGRGHG